MENIFRYSIKAIIIRDNKILVESCDYGRGRFCKLPGGGHQWGETMSEALIRECKEELNLDVIPIRLILARDYIAKNHFQTIDTDCFHQAELMFECSVILCFLDKKEDIQIPIAIQILYPLVLMLHLVTFYAISDAIHYMVPNNYKKQH